MNARVKKLWVKALRSGKYKQGRFALRVKDRFCCLGVLCDLHCKRVGGEWLGRDVNGGQAYLGEETGLPDEVVEWAGLKEADLYGVGNPLLGPVRKGKKSITMTAIKANDQHRKSFNFIADRIEKYL